MKDPWGQRSGWGTFTGYIFVDPNNLYNYSYKQLQYHSCHILLLNTFRTKQKQSYDIFLKTWIHPSGQIFTYKDGPRAERIKTFIMAVNP